MDIDLNDLISMRMDDSLLPILSDQFSYWKSDRGRKPYDLEIAAGRVDPPHLLRATDDYAFFDGGFVATRKGKIEFVPGKIIIEGPVDEDLAEAKFLIPAINQLLLRKGWCLAHASAIVYQGKTYLFPAMGGTGKTSIMLEFLSRGADFVGDDHVLISKDGDVALYPRWIHMMEYNWSLFPELFDRALPNPAERKAHESKLTKYRKGLRMRGGNLVSRSLKAHYTSFYYYDSRIRPELMFPGSKVVLRSKVNSAFFLETDDYSPSVVESSPSRLAKLTACSSEIESGNIFETLSILSGIDYLDYAHNRACMEGFFEHADCFEARTRTFLKRSDVVSAVDEQIAHMD